MISKIISHYMILEKLGEGDTDVHHKDVDILVPDGQSQISQATSVE